MISTHIAHTFCLLIMFHVVEWKMPNLIRKVITSTLWGRVVSSFLLCLCRHLLLNTRLLGSFQDSLANNWWYYFYFYDYFYTCFWMLLSIVQQFLFNILFNIVFLYFMNHFHYTFHTRTRVQTALIFPFRWIRDNLTEIKE